MTDQSKAHDGADRLVAKAFDRVSEEDFAHAVSQLSPQEAEMFLHKLEAALRKRKIMLSGYLVAMVAWVIALALALAYIGMAPGFVAWVLLVPFALVGVILWAFGAWAERASRAGARAVHSDEDSDQRSRSGSSEK